MVQGPLTGVLPVIQIEPAVAISSSLRMTCCARNIILNQVICRSRRSIDGVILIKMNTNFERNSPRTCGGMNGCRCGCIENCSTNPILPCRSNSSGRSSSRLKSDNLQIVSKSFIAGNSRIEGCDSRAQTSLRT